MVAPFDVIAFDADDTLWENNGLYLEVRDRVKQIIARYVITESMDEQLDEIEIRNLKFYGYGIMGFILSLVESAIEITGGRISAGDISAIVAMAKDMIAAEVRLLNHAEEALRELSGLYPLLRVFWLACAWIVPGPERRPSTSGVRHRSEAIPSPGQ